MRPVRRWPYRACLWTALLHFFLEPNMIETSGHHIVYGELRDYLTGELLPDTDDERVCQELARHLVEELGYAKEELTPRLSIVTDYGNRVVTTIDLTVSVEGRRMMILRFGPGSLVTREKAAVAAARLLEPAYRIPLAVVTNGRDAELLETAHGKVLATGMDCIPRREAALKLMRETVFKPFSDPEKREQAQRILNVFDLNICCLGAQCHPPD